MFFKEVINKLGTVPQYMIYDIVKYKNDINCVADKRALLGIGSDVLSYVSASQDLQTSTLFLRDYISSQHFSCLKNMVPIETAIVVLPNTIHESPKKSRYLCRVGEQIVIPLINTMSITSSEFGISETLETGSIYRLNNRISSVYVGEENFLALTFLFIDFDMKKYLLPHDLNSPFEKQKDEFLDPSDYIESKEVKYSY